MHELYISILIGFLAFCFLCTLAGILIKHVKMKNSLFVIPLILVFSLSLKGQNELLTTPEKTNFESTSTYTEVISFIEQLEIDYPNNRIIKIATSTEGRTVPLQIIADPMPASPDDLENDERIVVFIQANIHAGEVEGKEATQMLARDILNGSYKNVLNEVILLICPILNPDGNEKFSTQNRTNQNGPANGVGVRHNGQFLDLNRDAMKVETPEIQGVISEVLNKWDPAISVDCHTTNGSYHKEPVTFTWMMNPNGDRSLINYMRDKMMPAVGDQLRSKYKTENCFYGVFVDWEDYNKGWVSYASEPRYVVNYIGVRNRLSILNENYVYADFKSRVYGSYHFLKSVVDFAVDHKTEIKHLLKAADEKVIARGFKPSVADSFAIKYEARPTPEKVTIMAYEVDKIEHENPWRRYKKSDREITVHVPYIADYYPTESIRFPYMYLITVNDPDLVAVLKTHGIKMEKLTDTVNLEVERFKIEELSSADRINQGHYTNIIKGSYIQENRDFPEGTIIVRTAQKLGTLAAYLLEPQADDGLLKWNYFDRYLVPQWGRRYYPYPVYRVLEKVDIRSGIVE